MPAFPLHIEKFKKKRNLSKIMPQGFCNCVSIMLMTTAIRKQMTN